VNIAELKNRLSPTFAAQRGFAASRADKPIGCNAVMLKSAE